MTSLYSILNGKAKNWWNNRRLRECGQVDEARCLERESIRSAIQTIRTAELFRVSDRGFSVYCGKVTSGGYDTYSTLQGYGDGSEYAAGLKQTRAGIPRVDTRTIPENLRFCFAFSGPLVAIGGGKADPPGMDGRWGGLRKAPIPIYLAVAEGLGATVHWGDFEKDREESKQSAGPTVAYLLNL